MTENKNLKNQSAQKINQEKAEKAYLQLVKIYRWAQIECVKNEKLKTPEKIHQEVYHHIQKILLPKPQMTSEYFHG